MQHKCTMIRIQIYTRHFFVIVIMHKSLIAINSLTDLQYGNIAKLYHNHESGYFPNYIIVVVNIRKERIEGYNLKTLLNII